MTVPRVLVTGANGMLGRALVDAWRDVFLVCGASGTEPREGWWVGSLTEPEAARRLIDWAAPNLVVHTAAWTDVDGCERDPARASAVNATATRELAAAARTAGAAFVYISTSAVFDGRDGRYTEDAPTNPVNVYGVTKLAGEKASLDECPRSLILRICLEGWRTPGRPGFIQWVVEGLRRGEERRVVTDWIHTPIVAGNVPAIIEALVETGARGVFHAGTTARVSNWDMAIAAARVFDLDASLLTPIHSSDLRLPAPRPRDTSLVSDRLTRVLGPVTWELDAALGRMRGEETATAISPLRTSATSRP